jgi:hypothetical protein
MITPRKKYVVLYYCNGNRAKDIVLTEQEFMQVFICPKMEMQHNTPMDVASELIQYAVSPDWRWRLRRPVAPGDLFTVDTEIYAFVEPDNMQLDMRPIHLTNWKHLAISRLGHELCTVLTSRTPSSSLLSQ